MGSYSVVLFSLLLISSIIFITSIENSFADEVIATSIGFEDSTILELKNSKGNVASIDSVRIWLGEGNNFKSFKTETGWMGINTPQGVIIFTSQKELDPGKSVKFGIKTTKQNPVINWKAVNSDGEIITTASTITKKSSNSENENELNQSKIFAIKDESVFRFIPEKPGSNSEFRVIGNNFVPNQSMDFYINTKLTNTIQTDRDGRILFTSKTPDKTNDERIEFSLVDTGGKEKTLSIRVLQIDNREISQSLKISLGITPKEVKRGDVITLEGMATPNTTLTITSKHPDGKIIDINTIQVKFNGKWEHEKLFSPELNLGVVSIEISDGKSMALRNINVISAKIINITTLESKFEPGDLVSFEGTVIPNEDISIILEDAVGTEIYSRSLSVGETGMIRFDIKINRGAVEGTYVLTAFQGNEEGSAIFGVGQEPEPIIILRPLKLNYSSEDTAKISIQGPTNSQISLILIDSADREKISESVNLGANGRLIYEIDTVDLPTGAYTLSAKRGESSGSTVFTIGLTTGSGAITVQTTRDDYIPGEQVLILGNTGSINVLLDITITDPNGNVIKSVNTFSNKFGVFKIDNFRIPNDANTGEWLINAKSGGNFKEHSFKVLADGKILIINTDKNNYIPSEIMEISGNGANMSATVTISIINSDEELIEKLNITAKSNGEYSTIWRVPSDMIVGEYTITADDGSDNTMNIFSIV
jgi:hypothetical protein